MTPPGRHRLIKLRPPFPAVRGLAEYEVRCAVPDCELITVKAGSDAQVPAVLRAHGWEVYGRGGACRWYCKEHRE